MIETDRFGYYRATNEGGFISWYEFACEIFQQAGLDTQVVAIPQRYICQKQCGQVTVGLIKTNCGENGFETLPDRKDTLKRYLSEESKVRFFAEKDPTVPFFV